MARLIWTAEARGWLRQIYEYISKDSPEAAFKVVRGVYDHAHLLLEFPEMGYLYRPRKFPGVRILLYGHYRILYGRGDDAIHILGVFHGALDLKRHVKLGDKQS